MGYRGEDLDLRTPQTWSATPSDLATAAGEGALSGGRGRRSATLAPRNGPIWVDDTVLAVCNHAYDVAAAHRAAEVRIEHLLHALTRIDTAAEVLEERGIRVAGLRRDTATVIASELPVAPPSGLGAGSQPRRSSDLADVLRLAAAHAYRRNAPASVEDLLFVLDGKGDLPGMGLITRHSGHAPREAHEQPAPLPRAPIYAEPRYTAEPAERTRPSRPGYRAAETSYRAPETHRAPAPEYRIVERIVERPAERPVERTIDRVPEPSRPTATDALQNARLETLEQAVRNLGLDLADERANFAGILQDLQRDLGAQRDDTSRHSGGLHERLMAIEQMVSRPRDDGPRHAEVVDRLVVIEQGLQHRLNDLARSWNGLAERIETMEQTVSRQRDDGPRNGELGERLAAIEQALQHRLNDLARSWNGLAERIEAIEQTVQETARQAAHVAVQQATREMRVDPVDIAPLDERLGQLERTLRDGLNDSSRHWLGLNDKLKAVEQVLTAPATPAALDMGPLSSRLDFIEEALLGRDSEPTRELADRIGAIEQSLAAARSQTFETSAALGAEVKALAGALATQATTAERFQSSVGERFAGLATALERQRTEIAAAASGPVTERLMALTQAGDRHHAEVKTAFESYDKRLADRVQAVHTAQRSETAAALAGLEQKLMNGVAAALKGLEAQNGAVGNAVQGLEQRFQGLDQRFIERFQGLAEAQSGYGRDLTEVHDALVKLNANQHTLAGSIEQWRTDASGDISVIANRMGALEQETKKPMQLLSAVASNMDTVHRIAVDRNNRRRRFWYWLFGTDDWLAASWPDQASRVDTSRMAAKTRIPSDRKS